MLKRKKQKTDGAQARPVLDEEQIAAIQPFLSRLLTRYQEVADTGHTDRPDPICATLHTARKDLSCVDCPVWGLRRFEGQTRTVQTKRGPREREIEPILFVHCENYYPARPEIIEDTVSEVRVPVTGEKREDNEFAAKAWGWSVVMWLQGLRR